MPVVALTAAERASSCCSLASCTAVAAAVAAAGWCTIENLVDPAELEALARRLDLDAAVKLQQQGRGDPDGEGHLALGLPRVADWLPPALAANPLVEQLAAAVLPDNAWLAWVGGKTNLPGSGEQDLHSDAAWAFQSAEEAAAGGGGGGGGGGGAAAGGSGGGGGGWASWPQASSQVIFQFGGGRAIGPADGPTEIWPGSHADTRWAQFTAMQFSEAEAASAVPPFDFAALVATRRMARPPVQMLIPAGAAVVRDLRMWHRGMSNASSRPR